MTVRTVRPRAVLLIAGAVACASPRGQSDATDGGARGDTTTVVTLERGGCRGRCPIYGLQLQADGRVLFTGTRFVRTIGIDSARVSGSAVAVVQRAFVQRNFAQNPAEIGYGTPSCGQYTADLPTVVLTLRQDDRLHRVRFDEGCRGHPAVLDTLARLVDSLGGSSRWMMPAGT